MSSFFTEYNIQILILFRILVALEFVWKCYILALEFKSEEAMDPEHKRYIKITIIYALVTFILSFFLKSKYALFFIAIRLILFFSQLINGIVEDFREYKQIDRILLIFVIICFLTIGALFVVFAVSWQKLEAIV